MAVGKLCTREVAFIGMHETVAQAARMMRERHVGSVVAVQAGEFGNRPAGMITDRDIAVEVVATGLNPERTTVASVMRAGAVCIEEHESISRAVDLMRSEGVRRLPVVDSTGALVGLLAADDLLDLIAAEFTGLAGMRSRSLRREHDTRSTH